MSNYRCAVPGCTKPPGVRQWAPENWGRAGALPLCYEHEGIDFKDLLALRDAAGAFTPNGDALLIEEAHYTHHPAVGGGMAHYEQVPDKVLRESQGR
jgi:hypothetical protein